MPGVWANPLSAPFHVGTMLLLTDGSVLAQNSGTTLWWRLRPDRAGGYDHGGWQATGESASAPLYFASAVMADGAVFMAGGEYSNNAHNPSDLCTAERYDPVAETWSTLPTPTSWTAIGDAPCCVLPDGRLLLGNILAGPCALWDPAAGTWTATGPKLNGSSSEETWTLLPDGSVLTIDCIGSPASERFVGEAWIANDRTPVDLVEAASLEIGPAVLLPDGTVFALGATGRTARFTPGADDAQPGTWAAGPDVPLAAGQPLGAKDAPACLLPNGRVLCAVGPVDGAKDTYAGPARFLEFDPAGPGSWQALAAPPGDSGLAPFAFRFLLLPNGQVLASNGTPTVQVFEPDGAARPEWAPTILTCPTEIRAGATARLQGAQLNGLSQACSYGDDAAMATNYPLVRLRGPYPSEAVTYARTFGHSTMGVATGASAHHTSFETPAHAAPGIYALSVIANGVASAERPVNLTASNAPTRRPPVDGQGQRRTFGEEELFLRDLSEVHMLIDFVSGRADKSLAGLTGAETRDTAGKPVAALSAQEIVEEICKISYPPTGGLEANAQQAAFMLMVKDRLNYLAAPARGLTVAFTSMFAGVALDLHPLPAWRFWGRSKKTKAEPGRALVAAEIAGPLGKPAADTASPRKDHFYSAQAAFPNLETPARRFRRFYDRLPAQTALLILFIAYLNWDISVISGILQQISAAEASYTNLFDSKQSFLPTPAACNPASAPTTPAAKPAVARPPPTPARRHAPARPAAPPAAAKPSQAGPQTLTEGEHISCAEADAALLRLAAARANLQTVLRPGLHLHPVALSMELMEFSGSGPAQHAASPTVAGGRPQPTRLEDFTIDVLGGFNTIIMPTAFGLLGTLAGLMRTITLKMRESILAPRDVIISKIGIGLGMSAGLAVGLFMNGAKGPGSTITLTAAGLSFLAGFGAEAFFTFLDVAISRLFTVGQQAAPPPTPQARQSSVAPPK